VTDSATEFTSEYFSNFLQRFDVKTTTIAPHAHWQNGHCERHGHVPQEMLSKIEAEHPINTYMEMHQALIQCTQAKNSLSIRRGYSPEVLVFGKSSRLPGSITSSVNDTFLASADRDDAQGVAFRKSLDFREKARRTRPDRVAYQPGEWVMMWQPEKPTGYWFAPLKVVNQESHFSIWATQIGKLYRRAPEHVRPLCTSEARMIPEDEVNESLKSNESTMTPSNPPEDDNLNIPHNDSNLGNDNTSHQDTDNSSQSIEQPDNEPDAIPTPPEFIDAPGNPDPGVETPIPDPDDEEGFATTHFALL
jgi:hypothetical protein